jgi:hypothetical protein
MRAAAYGHAAPVCAVLAHHYVNGPGHHYVKAARLDAGRARQAAESSAQRIGSTGAAIPLGGGLLGRLGRLG